MLIDENRADLALFNGNSPLGFGSLGPRHDGRWIRRCALHTISAPLSQADLSQAAERHLV